jgi:NSS family neurotransmitter:Na+ symporter
VFAYNINVGGGPGLLFVTLPRILQDIPFGQFFAILLYLAMIFAGVSSLQNMFEAVGESLLKKIPALTRKFMLFILCAVCLGAGLNMEPIFKWGPWMDIISIYIIPIGATIGAVSWFWIMKKDDLMDEINKGAIKVHGNHWYLLGKFVYVPLAAILCVVALFKQIAF